MAKSNKVNTLLIGFLSLIFGGVAFSMLFVNVISYTGKLSSITMSFVGSDIAFGKESLNLSFNFVIVLAFALPVLAGIFSLFGGKSVIVNLISVLLFVAGGALIFLTCTFATIGMNETMLNVIKAYNPSLGVGAIVAGSLSCLGGVITLFRKPIVKLFK